MSNQIARKPRSYLNEELLLEQLPIVMLDQGFVQAIVRKNGAMKFVDAVNQNGETVTFWIKQGWTDSPAYSAIQFGLFARRQGGSIRGLTYIRTSFCKNLHAKCYMNEEMCIVTSLNLYEFSQVNNNEMGILIRRGEDTQLYKDAYEEAQRIIRISDEVRISMERISSEPETASQTNNKTQDDEQVGDKLPTSKLAQKMGMKLAQLLELAVAQGYLTVEGDKHSLSLKGEKAGIEFIAKSRFGPYFLWPQDFKPT